MTSADKFGVIFTVAFVAAMIAIMAGALQPDSTPAAPSVAAPAQTYSPPPPPPSSPAPAEAPSMAPQAAPQSSSSENLKYTIRGGIVETVSPDEHHNAVKIIMDSRLDGQLTITLTGDAVTPFDDGTYFVTVDGEEVDFVQVGKRLTIDFLANAEEVMIYGEGFGSGSHDMSSMGHSEDSKEHEAMMAAEKAAAAAAEKAAAAAAEKAAAAAAKAPMEATVEPVEGSGAPGCEPECYTPTTVTISAGGSVIFSNTDTAPHTATSGSAVDGPDGIFDTSLIMVNASYSVTLSDVGTYTYFCMVHPWMEGTVIVE